MRGERLRAALGGVPCEWLAEVDSSNSELLRRAERLPDRYVLLADQQSAGRGRRGRSWVSPPGANLYLSMFARLGREPVALSLAIGIAAAECLRQFGASDVRLKWPNDLVVGERKLGGILIDIAAAQTVVVGIGVNLAMPGAAAAAIDQPWIDLAGLGVRTDVESVAARLAPALLAALDEFAAAGFAPFEPRWPALDALAGQAVRIDGGARAGGRVLGIAADGALRLQDDAGEWRCHAGEVSLRRQ